MSNTVARAPGDAVSDAAFAVAARAGPAVPGPATAARELAAEAPPKAPSQALLAGKESTPSRVAAQLGADYDAGTLTAAYARLASMPAQDVLTTLQILRVNGSNGSRDRKPYQWLVDNRASAGPGARVALTAIGNTGALQEVDIAALPPDDEHQIRAFTGLARWDDPSGGLPRWTYKRTTPVLSALQRDMLALIRRRREVATPASGTVRETTGYQYTGRPTADPLPTGTIAGSLDAEIWHELDSEGSASAVNTYDDQHFTWGKGWSAKSTLGAIVDAFFAADPAARQELLEAGFTRRDGTWLWVDTHSGWVIEGQRAIEQFRMDPRFVGLLAHLVEDPLHQQKMVDAQWAGATTKGAVADVPPSIRGWPTVSIRFGAHCVHWGQSWASVASNGPGVGSLLRWISTIKGRPKDGATIVDGTSSQTIRNFAGGAVKALMSLPVELPATLEAGMIYYQLDTTSKHWTAKP